MPIPDNLQPYLRVIAGFCVFVLGASFAWKCFEASFHGKMKYWSGLQQYGMLFIPVTILSPFFCHMPAGKNSLIKTRQETYVHCFYGPPFFLLALMFLTAGADLMGLPGTSSMNMILTCGRRDVPPAITYTPPFTYKFPILKKATKTIRKALIIKIPVDRKKSLNAWEQKGVNVEKETLHGIGAEEDEED